MRGRKSDRDSKRERKRSNKMVRERDKNMKIGREREREIWKIGEMEDRGERRGIFTSFVYPSRRV